MVKRTTAYGLALVVGVLTGCNAGGGQAPNPPPADKGGEATGVPSPSPTGIKDVTEPSTAEGTVFRLIRRLGSGGIPFAVEEYSRELRRKVGEDDLLGALASLSSTLKTANVEVVEKERTEGGTLFTVVVRAKGEPPQRASYFVRRERSVWKVAYDSLLGDALATYAQRKVQIRIDPDAEKAAPQAVTAAEAAAREYRELASGGSLSD